MTRPTILEMPREAAEFDAALLRVVSDIQKDQVSSRLSEENMARYTHGRRWSHRASPYSIDGEMKAVSAEWETGFKDLVEGDLSLVPRFVLHLSEQLGQHFAAMMYATVNEACEVSGNTVSAANAGSFSAGFMEAMRKIEFSVDRQGNVSLPEIHVAPQSAAKMVAELEAQPPEYRAEIERLKAEKTATALQREQERKAKFRRAAT